MVQLSLNSTGTTEHPEHSRPELPHVCGASQPAFGCPRDFLNNRFVYLVVSPRARGLSIGVNMNPDKRCNFDCIYCEVHRGLAPRENRLDADVLAEELKNTLAFVHQQRLRELPWCQHLP